MQEVYGDGTEGPARTVADVELLAALRAALDNPKVDHVRVFRSDHTSLRTRRKRQRKARQSHRRG